MARLIGPPYFFQHGQDQSTKLWVQSSFVYIMLPLLWDCPQSFPQNFFSPCLNVKYVWFSILLKQCVKFKSLLTKNRSIRPWIIREFKQRRRRRQRQRERQKSNRFFLHISLPLLHDYDVKMPNFTFYGGRKQATTKLSSLSKLKLGPQEINSREICLH